MGFVWVSSTEISSRAAKSAEQEQAASMCRLVLLYSAPKIN